MNGTGLYEGEADTCLIFTLKCLLKLIWGVFSDAAFTGG